MSRNNNLVDFYIVGQQKSGTTALASYLAKHPQICLSVPKEPNFMASDIIRESDDFHGYRHDFKVRTDNEYMALFSHEKYKNILGEASAIYLYSKEAAKNIYNFNPDARIIILLREPVEFLYSLYNQYVNEATEDELDFEAALVKEVARKEGNALPKLTRSPSLLFYSERIKYADQVRRYLDYFPKENILIFTNTDLLNNAEKVYQSILSALNADLSFTPEFRLHNTGKKPRFIWINRVIRSPAIKNTLYKVLGTGLYTRLQKEVAEKLLLKNAERTEIPEDLRYKMQKMTQSEVVKISELIKRDLVSEWNYQ